MDERGANIDIVFRNGLKDYEVLPPPEVWDNIHPVLKRKQIPFLVLRAAASVTVLLSISYLAYRWSREVTTGLDDSVMALNIQATDAVFSPSRDLPLINVPVAKTKVQKSSGALIQDIQAYNTTPETEKITSPENVFLRETNISPDKAVLSLRGTLVASLKPLQKKSIEILPVDMIYMPENSAINKTERWSVSAMASPTYYSKFISGSDAVSKQLMASEQNLSSYTGGVVFSYKISKKFSIQSGIYYSSVGQMLEGINSYGGFQKYDYTKGDHNFEILTTNGTIFTKNADVFLASPGPVERILTAYTNDVFDPKKASLQYINNNLHQNFSYLELPVIMKYKFVDKLIDLNLIGGLSYNMLVSNSVFTLVNGVKYPVGTTEGLNPVSLSSTLGMGMEYNLSDKLSLNLEPTIRYYLNPYTQMTVAKVHPYSFGIFSGLSYKF
jgi:hypothetical protein